MSRESSPQHHVTLITPDCRNSKSATVHKHVGNEGSVSYSHSVMTRGHQQRSSAINAINSNKIPTEVCWTARVQTSTTLRSVNVSGHRCGDNSVQSRSSTPSPIRQYTCTDDSDVGELISLFKGLTINDNQQQHQHQLVAVLPTSQPTLPRHLTSMLFLRPPMIITAPLYTRLRLCCGIPRPVTMTSAMTSATNSRRSSEKQTTTKKQQLMGLTGQQQRWPGTTYRSSPSHGTGNCMTDRSSRETWPAVRDCGKMSSSRSHFKTRVQSMDTKRISKTNPCSSESDEDRRASSQLTRTPCQLMTRLLRVSCRIPQPVYNRKHVINSSNIRRLVPHGMMGPNIINAGEVNQIDKSDDVTKHNGAEGGTRRMVISGRTRFVTRGDQHKLSIDSVTSRVAERVTSRARISSDQGIGVTTSNVRATLFQSAEESSSSISGLRSSTSTSESHVPSELNGKHKTTDCNHSTSLCSTLEEPQVLTIVSSFRSTVEKPQVPTAVSSPSSTLQEPQVLTIGSSFRSTLAKPQIQTTFCLSHSTTRTPSIVCSDTPRRCVHLSEQFDNGVETLPLFAKFFPVSMRSSRRLESTGEVTDRHGEPFIVTSRMLCEMNGDIAETTKSSSSVSSLGPAADYERRFDGQLNELYCEHIASWSKNPPSSNHWAVLYTSGQCNKSLWWTQKALALAALSSFFDPCRSVLCVRCGDRSMLELIDVIVADDPDAKWVIGGQVSSPAAVLRVSSSAGRLIRHNRLQFLASLCLVLDIDKNRLVVLQTSMT